VYFWIQERLSNRMNSFTISLFIKNSDDQIKKYKMEKPTAVTTNTCLQLGNRGSLLKTHQPQLFQNNARNSPPTADYEISCCYGNRMFITVVIIAIGPYSRSRSDTGTIYLRRVLILYSHLCVPPNCPIYQTNIRHVTAVF
jgi:hypothetical protein